MEADQLQNVHWVVLASVLGFLLLAFLLLYPVYRFLTREETASRKWTRDEIAREARRHRHGGDGATEEPPEEGRP